MWSRRFLAIDEYVGVVAADLLVGLASSDEVDQVGHVEVFVELLCFPAGAPAPNPATMQCILRPSLQSPNGCAP